MRRKDFEKEQRVKQAVVRLILEEGFEGASIAKIARAAGVSPATVYIYYENKEQMLASIYREYATNAYEYLAAQMRAEMDAAQLVRALMTGYYSYITENLETFRFVERCAHCPTLAAQVCGEDMCQLFDLLDCLKERGSLRRYSNENLASVMFCPVKALSMDYPAGDSHAAQLLDELIGIIQRAIVNE